jgi:4-hydroxybenzoate polyprenyltransferase
MRGLVAPILRLMAGALAAAIVFAVVQPWLVAFFVVALAALYQVKPAHWRALPELALGFAIAAAIMIAARQSQGS